MGEVAGIPRAERNFRVLFAGFSVRPVFGTGSALVILTNSVLV